MRSSRSGVFSGRVNPTEYDNRCPVSQARTAWVAPALSVRISTLRPALVPGRWPGSSARDALSTSMWSVAVFDPALPAKAGRAPTPTNR